MKTDAAIALLKTNNFHIKFPSSSLPVMFFLRIDSILFFDKKFMSFSRSSRLFLKESFLNQYLNGTENPFFGAFNIPLGSLRPTVWRKIDFRSKFTILTSL